MGLDVYLYKCPDRALAETMEKKANDFSDTAWASKPNYDDFTQEEKDAIRTRVDAYEKECGFDGHYQHASREKIEINSSKYPEHYFKIGYFRSSYNGSGFNHIMEQHGLPTLYDMFGVEGEGTEDPPDWEDARARVVKAVSDYGEFLKTPAARWHIIDVNSYGNGPTDEREALQAFEKNYHKSSFDEDSAYSSSVGLFFPKAAQIVGAIPGVKYGSKVTYIILDSDPPKWYIQSLEIVLETIDYVLAQPDKEQYYLSWSG